MLECRDIDALMIDRLYDELDPVEGKRFDAHVEGCARCRAELAGLERTRAALREMPDEEPPSSLSAILLHEAARHAPAAPARAAAPMEEEEPRGVLAWLLGLLEPIVAHPAATAVATLVLVAGIAGSLYLRGDHHLVEPVIDESTSAATAPALEPPAMVRMPDENRPEGAAAAAGDETVARGVGNQEADQAAAKNGALDLARNQQGYAADIATGDKSVIIDGLRDPSAGEIATKSAQPAPSRDRRMTARLEEATPTHRTVEPAGRTNAVTGADMLVDLDDDTGPSNNKIADHKKTVTRKSGSKPVAGAAPDVPKLSPPPPQTTTAEVKELEAAPSYRVYKDTGVASEQQKLSKQQVLRWARGKQQQLENLVRLKKCRDAARVANDILDRTPDFYYQKVGRSAAVKTCSGFVEAERKTRAAKRYRARAAKKRPASAPAKAKAAPQRDEAVESE